MTYTVKTSSTAKTIYGPAGKLAAYIPGEVLNPESPFESIQVVLPVHSINATEAIGVGKMEAAIWVSEAQIETAIVLMQAVLKALRGDAKEAP